MYTYLRGPFDPPSPLVEPGEGNGLGKQTSEGPGWTHFGPPEPNRFTGPEWQLPHDPMALEGGDRPSPSILH